MACKEEAAALTQLADLLNTDARLLVSGAPSHGTPQLTVACPTAAAAAATASDGGPDSGAQPQQQQQQQQQQQMRTKPLQLAAAAKRAARPRKGGGGGRRAYPSSTAARRSQLDSLQREADEMACQLRGLQLQNRRLRLKHNLLGAINGATEALVGALMQHGEASGSSWPAQTVEALSALEMQLAALQDGLPLPASSSDIDTPSSGSTGSPAQQQSTAPSGSQLPSGSMGSPQPQQLLQQQATQQQQQQEAVSACGSAVAPPASLCSPEQQEQEQQPDSLADPLWLLKCGLPHLDLAAAAIPTVEERLAAFQQVQGHISLLLHIIDAGDKQQAQLPGSCVGAPPSASEALAKLRAIVYGWAGHVISAHVVAPFEHFMWSITNVADMTQRQAPPEYHQHVIARLQMSPAQLELISLGLLAFHELLGPLRGEQARLQQQLQQLPCALSQLLPAGGSSGTAARRWPPAQPYQQQQQAGWGGMLLRVPELAPGDASAEVAAVLRQVEATNWKLSWLICQLNFFVSGVLTLRQLARAVIYTWPWQWWPGPFAEEVLRAWQAGQQQA